MRKCLECKKSCASVKKEKMRQGQKTDTPSIFGYPIHLTRNCPAMRNMGDIVLGDLDSYMRPIAQVDIELSIGRKIKSTEVVHHKNGNRRDNRLENAGAQQRVGKIKK